MAAAVVQTLTQTNASGQVTSLQSGAFGSSITAGNGILVALIGVMGPNFENIGITDTNGSTYNCLYAAYYDSVTTNSWVGCTNGQYAQPAANMKFVAFFYAQNAPSGASDKLTYTVQNSHTAKANIAAIEISGLTTAFGVDAAADNSSQAAADPTVGGGTYSTNHADEIVLMGFMGQGATGNSYTRPTGSTQLLTFGGGSSGPVGQVSYIVESATISNQTFTWTGTASKISTWVAIAASVASSGPTTDQLQPAIDTTLWSCEVAADVVIAAGQSEMVPY